MVDVNDAGEVRARSEATGTPPCDHPTLRQEVMMGMKTGDYVCVSCGELFTSTQYRKLKEEREQRRE